MKRLFPQALLILAAAAGLILSIVSKLKICSACSETANYSIFGMDFGIFGIAFFTLFLVAVVCRTRLALAGWLTILLIFSSLGAEIRFVWLQKFVIGQWCPICLWIALTVTIAAGTVLYEIISHYRSSGGEMKRLLKQILLVFVAGAIGLTGAVFGVTNNALGSVVDPYLGKTGSTTTVYFVSDWFCPACRKLEPVIEHIYPEIAKSVKVGFVDFPIHKETLNFTPYNLQFLYFEKARYLTLRKALSALALKTKKPTQEEVQAAVAPYGVKLRTVDYSDILFGMQSDLTVYRGYNVKATPSVVVTNSKTGKTKLLVGDKEITLQGVKAAIAEVGR